jgi:hypothetical protein
MGWTVVAFVVFVEVVRELLIGARNVGGGTPRTAAALLIVVALGAAGIVGFRMSGAARRWRVMLVALVVLDMIGVVLIGLWSAI